MAMFLELTLDYHSEIITVLKQIASVEYYKLTVSVMSNALEVTQNA